MTSDKCREAFEAKYPYLDMTPAGDWYLDIHTSERWKFWQAAWTASREELAKEQARDGIRLVKFVDSGTLEPRKFECEGDDDAE
mgnify:CR=1 FL=1